MNYAEFDEYRTDLLNEASGLMYCKGEEYANSTDRFGNFRRLSATLGIPDYQVAWVLTAKHLDAISSYMRLGRTTSTETFRGRIIDAINYLTFIGGMVTEKENREDAEMQTAMAAKSDADERQMEFDFGPIGKPIGKDSMMLKYLQGIGRTDLARKAAQR